MTLKFALHQFSHRKTFVSSAGMRADFPMMYMPLFELHASLTKLYIKPITNKHIARVMHGSGMTQSNLLIYFPVTNNAHA